LKISKDKQKAKNSYINIDNVQKRIYPKKLKGNKKLNESKKIKEKYSSRSKQSSTITHECESHWSETLIIILAPSKVSVPKFEIDGEVSSCNQLEASKLASYAHNLRRSYIQSGNQRESGKSKNVVSEATKYYGGAQSYRMYHHH
jgi:hypothetical protein